MQKYFAFLRAINVGGRNVRMEDLRAHFERFGCTEVETYIASGNVVFEWNRAKVDLNTYLSGEVEKALGYEATTFVRSGKELSAIASFQPFTESELAGAWVVNVGFLSREVPPGAIEEMNSKLGELHSFRAGKRELYWMQRIPTSEVKLPRNYFEKTLGSLVTFRSTKTIVKLAVKYGL